MGNKMLVVKVEGGYFHSKAKQDGEGNYDKNGKACLAKEGDDLFNFEGKPLYDLDEHGERKSWARMDVWQLHREKAFLKGIVAHLAVESWQYLEPFKALVPFIADVSEESGRMVRDSQGKMKPASIAYDIDVTRANIPYAEFLALEKKDKSPDIKPPKSPPLAVNLT